MQWQQIVGFYYVGKLGSMSRAAEATNRTPSAVSHQIKFLERQLGCSLLQRETRSGYTLTAEGREVFKFAQKALRDHDTLIKRIDDLKATNHLKLTVSAPIDTLTHELPSVVAAFRHQHDHVELTILERTMEEIVDGIRTDEIDIGLGIGSAIPPDLKILEWKRLRYYVVMPVDHPLAMHEEISLSQITSYPLILPAANINSTTRQTLKKVLKKQGLSYRVSTEVSNVNLGYEYCQSNSGLYLALCSEDMMSNLPEDLIARSLSNYFSDEFISIYYQESRASSNVNRLFVDALFEDNSYIGPTIN